MLVYNKVLKKLKRKNIQAQTKLTLEIKYLKN